MKIGDLVKFPCSWSNYQYKTGILLAYRDNPSDARDWELKKKYGTAVPGYCKDGPRQVADVLYEGRIASCWKQNLKKHDKFCVGLSLSC